jgi:hypothetical protein
VFLGLNLAHSKLYNLRLLKKRQPLEKKKKKCQKRNKSCLPLSPWNISLPTIFPLLRKRKKTFYVLFVNLNSQDERKKVDDYHAINVTLEKKTVFNVLVSRLRATKVEWICAMYANGNQSLVNKVFLSLKLLIFWIFFHGFSWHSKQPSKFVF